MRAWARGLGEAAGSSAADHIPCQPLIDRLLSPSDAGRMRRRALRAGVDPLESAVARGLLDHRMIARSLAQATDAAFVETCDGLTPAGDVKDYAAIARRGYLRVRRADGRLALLVAPRPEQAERALATLAARRGDAQALVTTPASFNALLRQAAVGAWAPEAVTRLAQEEPQLSAADETLMRRTARLVMLGIAGVFLALVASDGFVQTLVGGLIGAAIMSWLAFRLAAAATGAPVVEAPDLTDADLPRYTVLCALYREAEVVGGLIDSLARLDYPREKLDIKILLEEDDPATLAALRRAAPDAAVEAIVLPDVGPRTKPKALMMGLAFARGELAVVYDAEDRPGPGQLREAARRFAAADARLGCLQAPLVIANADETALSRLFAAEYDALFGVLLPALARWGLPMPLGGTSNHFRIQALRQTGGWDPFNVTEDADLGFRLARNGWRIGVIATPTLEEAPCSLAAFGHQRTRWFKGWLQTLVPFARDPARAARELGWRGLVAVGVTIAGSCLSATLHLACWLAAVVGVALHGAGGLPFWAFGVTACALAVNVLVTIEGLRRANRLRLTPWLALTPFYWALLGVSALRAVRDLHRQPFHWRKTTHGVSALLTRREGQAGPDCATSGLRLAAARSLSSVIPANAG